MANSKAKMAWEEVCLPKDKGGIGLIMTRDWNKAAMVRHIWNIANRNKDSIWVHWAKLHNLKENSF